MSGYNDIVGDDLAEAGSVTGGPRAMEDDVLMETEQREGTDRLQANESGDQTSFTRTFGDIMTMPILTTNLIHRNTSDSPLDC